MVPLPEELYVPSDILASKICIPSTYAEGDVQHEDDNEKSVNKKSDPIRITAKDKQSDLVVGPVKPKGMLKLNIYLDKKNNAVNNSSHARHIVLNENYKAI